jgi:hypothetical protein
MMGMTFGVLIYVVLSFVFIVIFTSICYELSPYSRRASNVSLPEWERKTLYTVAGYRPLSLLLLGILAMVIPGWENDIPLFRIIVWFCTAHMVISVIGAAGAWYLRQRNRRNTVYFVTDLFSGCIYACCLIMLFFNIHH